MKKNRILSACLLILQLCLVSGGFFAGYLLLQDMFAVPSEVAAYVKEARVKRENAGTTKAAETKEKAGVALPSEMRHDLYLLLGEDGNLQAVAAGYLNAAKQEAKLVTVPLDSYVDLPEEFYRELAAEFPTIPQVFELGVLTAYVGEDRIGAVVSGILEELRVCSFDWVWTLSAKEVSDWLKQENGIMVLTEQAKEWMLQSPAKKQVLKQLEALEQAEVGTKETLLSQSDGLKPYAEVIAVMSAANIQTERAAGKQENESYRLSLERMAQQLNGLYSNTADAQ